jgi:hypothetical protein
LADCAVVGQDSPLFFFGEIGQANAQTLADVHMSQSLVERRDYATRRRMKKKDGEQGNQMPSDDWLVVRLGKVLRHTEDDIALVNMFRSLVFRQMLEPPVWDGEDTVLEGRKTTDAELQLERIFGATIGATIGATSKKD